MGKKKRQGKRQEEDFDIEFEEVAPEEELPAEEDGEADFEAGEDLEDGEGLEEVDEQFDGGEEGDEEADMDEEEGEPDGDEFALEGSVGEFDEEEAGDGDVEGESAQRDLKKKLSEAKSGLNSKTVSIAERREKLLRQRVSQIQCKERRLKLLDK